MESLNPKKVVLIGNPGVGKSTLLNCLLQGKYFQSGLSIGRGLTTVSQYKDDGKGTLWIDTPGLSDIKQKDSAAREIVEVLRKGGTFQMIFVFVLDAGRIRVQDKETLKAIVRATGNRKDSYSIILNKVSRRIHQEIQQNLVKFLSDVNSDTPGTSSIYINLYRESLEDQDNAWVSDIGLTQFVQFKSQAVYLAPYATKDIETDEEIKMKEIKRLEEENARERARQEEQRKQIEATEKQRRAAEEQIKRLEEETARERARQEEQRKQIEAAEEQRRAVEEQMRVIEEQRRVAEEQRRAVEEQRRVVEEQQLAEQLMREIHKNAERERLRARLIALDDDYKTHKGYRDWHAKKGKSMWRDGNGIIRKHSDCKRGQDAYLARNREEYNTIKNSLASL